MTTIARNRHRYIDALFAQGHSFKIFSLGNCFSAEDVSGEWVRKQLNKGSAKLTDRGGGAYCVHIHSNLWYEFSTKPQPEPVAEPAPPAETLPIKAVKFTLTRAEGLTEECGTKTAQSWGQANAVLALWAWTAPDKGGYDKCDFTVTYADGEEYEGRYDLKRHDTTLADLGRHMRLFVEWNAGKTVKPHCGEATYRAYLARTGDLQEQSAAWLDRYEIGESAGKKLK